MAERRYRIPRAFTVLAKHGIVWFVLGSFVAGLPSDRGTFLSWLRVIGLGVVFVYFGAIGLAPFGIGPLGRKLTRAAKEDERDSWNRR